MVWRRVPISLLREQTAIVAAPVFVFPSHSVSLPLPIARYLISLQTYYTYPPPAEERIVVVGLRRVGT